MWWKPRACGYTGDLLEAGLYTKAQAERIARANYGRDERAVPVQEYLPFLRQAQANLDRLFAAAGVAR